MCVLLGFSQNFRAIPIMNHYRGSWLLGYVTSTSDLQPSTPAANQLPGQLVSTEIRTMYKYKF